MHTKPRTGLWWKGKCSTCWHFRWTSQTWRETRSKNQQHSGGTGKRLLAAAFVATISASIAGVMVLHGAASVVKKKKNVSSKISALILQHIKKRKLAKFHLWSQHILVFTVATLNQKIKSLNPRCRHHYTPLKKTKNKWANGKRHCSILIFIQKEKWHIRTNSAYNARITSSPGTISCLFFNDSSSDNATSGMTPDAAIEGAQSAAVLVEQEAATQDTIWIEESIWATIFSGV